GDLDDAQTYAALRTRLEAVDGDGSRPAGRGRLFYLAIPPSVYPEVIRHLHGSGVAPQERDPRAPSWVRVIIEKPFGHSLESRRGSRHVPEPPSAAALAHGDGAADQIQRRCRAR